MLSSFCNDLWHRYDKPIEGIKQVSLLYDVTQMMGLSKDCPDFWKNILFTIVLRPPHAQEVVQTLEVRQTHKAYHTCLTSCTFGILPGPAPSAFAASLTLTDNFNAISDNVDLSQKHVFHVTDVDQFQQMLSAATDAMVLNHISTIHRPTVPLDTAELNYISKGLSGALADKVIVLVSKMPKHVRDQLWKERKCFMCKKQGHITIVCPLLPETRLSLSSTMLRCTCFLYVHVLCLYVFVYVRILHMYMYIYIYIYVYILHMYMFDVYVVFCVYL